VVALQTDSPRESRPAWVEILVAIVVAIALVFGIYLIGRSVGDEGGDGVSAAAASENTQTATATASADATGTHSHDASVTASGTATGDDRGFSALANGEQHPHTFTEAVSPDDRVELARQMALARDVALQYPTVADAERAGLRRAGPFSPGLGAHYINFKGALGNADGAMSDDDIRQPLAWIYDGTHPDSRIAGLFYQTGKENAEGFAGPNDVWHVHHNVCIKPGANGVIDAPLGADHDATKEQCDAVQGQLLQRTQYLLHVWVVPGYESPEGVYSHLSSAITCDDGTYETIADVTKVGDATTICADGTE
jgi:hypothetical protein